MNILQLLVFLLLAVSAICYKELIITSGQPMVVGNKKVVNLDNLRVKKVNHSDHFLVGSFETFLDIGNDFNVS